MTEAVVMAAGLSERRGVTFKQYTAGEVHAYLREGLVVSTPGLSFLDHSHVGFVPYERVVVLTSSLQVARQAASDYAEAAYSLALRQRRKARRLAKAEAA